MTKNHVAGVDTTIVSTPGERRKTDSGESAVKPAPHASLEQAPPRRERRRLIESAQPSKSDWVNTNEYDAMAVNAVDLDKVDYFPMFWSSVQAAAITLIVQFLLPIYLALQLDVSIELRLWAKFIPYFALGTDYETFMGIVFWSCIGTSVALGAFALSGFISRRGLRVRMGRLFGFLDISLIGGLLLTRHWFFGTAKDQRLWMWALVVIGAWAFAIGSVIVNNQYEKKYGHLEDEREREANDELEELGAAK